MSALAALLDSLIDYAGLFPPAKLSMADAVRAYAAHRLGPDARALGRFVVPVARLGEFEAEHARLSAHEQPGWRVSALAGDDPAADWNTIAAFNSRRPEARIEAVETKAADPAAVAARAAAFPPGFETWVEISPKGDVTALVAAVKAAGRGAKLRTGGVTADAFPAATEIARFLTACHAAGVVLKATAGLHHPVRGEYPLTYEPGSPRATMPGFLNLFLAATLVHGGGAECDSAGGDRCVSPGGDRCVSPGASEADAIALLEDNDASSFCVAPDRIGWRNHRFSSMQLAATRQHLCRSFGSCSFTEPIEGLKALHWP